MNYDVQHEMIEGIERITYIPQNQQFDTPIVFQHGAWHGAWCWQYWQEVFAELGWVSHAHSLPSHGKSDDKRNIRLCTLGYYQDALREQVELCDTKPIVVGHSMGGAITQWYIKQWDDLSAGILLASMPLRDNVLRYIIADPLGMAMSTLIGHGKPLVRSPEQVKKLFISDDAIMSAEDLHAQLGAESILPPLQLNPFTWQPKRNPTTPMLVMAAERDTIFTVKEQVALKEHYEADYYLMKNTAHNAMMESNYHDHAIYLHNWLMAQGIT